MHLNIHKGAVAIEFALVMTFILVPLFLGTVEFGRLLYQYNALAKSVRDSAKYLSTVSDIVPKYDTYMKEAKCLVIHGNVGCTGLKIVDGLTEEDIDIDINPIPIIPGISLVKVSVDGFKPSLITNFLESIGIDNFAFNNISVSMRRQET